MAAGTVASLHRWPVKSMAGEQVTRLAVDELGAPGDRAHVILDPRGRRVSVRETPGVLLWAAAYPGTADGALSRASPPRPVITAPDGTRYAWGDPLLTQALSADLGRPVQLVRATDGRQDRPATLLVTIESSRLAAEASLGAPLDLRRFRSNLHLALDGEPYDEERWSGRRLRVGDADLEVLEGCVRCVVPTRDPDTTIKWPTLMSWLSREHDMVFGVIARALAPAVVRAGDRAHLI